MTVTFLNADIYFPSMNYSPNLTLKQQSNLKLINNTIATHLPFLKEIPHNTFTTEKDNIHWKLDTAKHIYWKLVYTAKFLTSNKPTQELNTKPGPGLELNIQYSFYFYFIIFYSNK